MRNRSTFATTFAASSEAGPNSNQHAGNALIEIDNFSYVSTPYDSDARSVYWNSTYIADAVAHMRAEGAAVPDALLVHTSPLTWEHIGFSGDFLWDRAAAIAGRRRPLNLGSSCRVA